jgi:hypothetical protein
MHNQEYSIINDCSDYFSLLTYYIFLSEQLSQLNRIVFSGTEAYDTKGQIILRYSSAHWIYYLAKK